MTRPLREREELQARECDNAPHASRAACQLERDTLRTQVVALITERDALREALRGFTDAFKLDWSGHALGELITKARTLLKEGAPQ